MEQDVPPRFEFSTEEPPSNVVVAGFSQFGLAGLTAVDFLADHLELTETGHVDAQGLPTLTPFEQGRPRHHTRLLSRSDVDLTVLVGELFVPVEAARPFSDAILDWVDESEVDEVVVLSGVPVPHGPDDHRTFYVATDDYRAHRLDGDPVPPMGNGFLDGVNGALVERGIATELEVGVFVTPVHAQMPDVEAAIRLVDVVDQLYDVDVDTGPLEAFGEEISDYYTELQEHMERQAESREGRMPEDRMFM